MQSTITKVVVIFLAAVAATSVWTVCSARPSAADEVAITGRPPVGLELLDKLMSGRSKVGDSVHFVTIATVYDANHDVLIPAGSPAFGTVTRSKGSGMFGKRGELKFTCDHAVLPSGAHVPLSGSNVSQTGANDLAETAAVTLLVSPLGLLIKGGTVAADTGTPIVMYIADGARVDSAAAAPRPLFAHFALKTRNAEDIDGKVVGFDGNVYTVSVGGAQRQVALSDIKSITVDVVPPESANN